MMTTTTNPYAPPTTDAASEAASPPTARSFARRLSLALAATGFVAFWIAVLLLVAYHGEDRDAADIKAGIVVVLAVAAHLVGIGVVFGAPRGRRLLPALLNAASLALMVALVAAGMSMKP